MWGDPFLDTSGLSGQEAAGHNLINIFRKFYNRPSESYSLCIKGPILK